MAAHIDRAIHEPARSCRVGRFLSRCFSADRVGSQPREVLSDDALLLGLVEEGGQVGGPSADGDEDVRARLADLLHRDADAMLVSRLKIPRGDYLHAERGSVGAEPFRVLDGIVVVGVYHGDRLPAKGVDHLRQRLGGYLV